MIDLGIIQLNWWQFLLAFATTVMGAARLTRVVTYDDFPPVVRLRILWDRLTNDGPWAKLVHCSWCFSFWATLLAMGTFLLTPLWVWAAWAWWIIWGGLALSYLAALVVFWDEGGAGE